MSSRGRFCFTKKAQNLFWSLTVVLQTGLCLFWVVQLITTGIHLVKINQATNPWASDLKRSDCQVVKTTYRNYQCLEELQIVYSSKSIYMEIEGIDEADCSIRLNHPVPCIYSESQPDNFQTAASFRRTLDDYEALKESQGTTVEKLVLSVFLTVILGTVVGYQ